MTQDETPGDLPSERWWRTRQIAEEVMASPDKDFERVLQEACGDDPSLMEEVRKLLAAADAYDDKSLAMGGAHDPEQGTRLGPYRLRRKIGEGGFGEVWLAEQIEPVQRRVAIKLIKPGMDSAQVIARFEAERQALAMMDHPNIASVLDAGSTDNGRPYFVMELVKGVRITEYARSAELDLEGRIEVMRQVCSAVQHAHQKGVIHRDLKPGNVLISEIDGKPIPKVIDFGVAKALERPLTDKTLFTEFRQFLGTPEYMSPEQASLSMMDVDTRSDVYSLGVMLYELLVGAPPFDPKSLRSAGFDEMRRIIREEEPLAPSDRLSRNRASGEDTTQLDAVQAERRSRQVRGELDWIVQRAMAKERDRRYASANDLNDDLGRYLDGEPVLAGPVSSVYRARRFVHRNRFGVGVAAALLLVVLGYVGLLIWDNVRIRSARAETEIALRIADERAIEAEQARDATEEALEVADERAIEALEARNKMEAAVQVAQERAEEAGQAQEAMEDALELARTRATEAEHARGDAELQTKISAATNRFLVQILSSSVPSAEEGKGIDTTLRVILDRAGRELDGSFPEHPEVEANMRKIIGQAYMAHGEDEQALLHLRQGLDISTEHLGDDHAGSLELAAAVTYALMKRQQWLEAEERIRTTIGLLEEKFGVDSFQALREREGLAIILKNTDRFEEAEEIYLATYEAVLAEFGAEHRATLNTIDNLSKLYRSWGRSDEAIRYARLGLEGRIRLLGPDSPEAIRSMTQLSTCLIAAAQYTEAKALLVDMIERSVRICGPTHYTTLNGRNELARILIDSRNWSEAAEVLEELAGLWVEVSGEEHSTTRMIHLELATCYRALGRLDEAEALAKRMTDLAIRLHGKTSRHVADGMGLLGRIHLEQGRFDEALAMARQALDIQKMTIGPDHPLTFVTMYDIAKVHRAEGDLVAAEALMEETLLLQRRAVAPNHPRLAIGVDLLARTEYRLGDIESAKVHAEEALRLTRSIYDEGSMQVAQVMETLIKCLFELDDLDRATTLCEEYCAIWEQVRGSDAQTTVNARELLREIYAKRAKQDPKGPWKEMRDNVATGTAGLQE